MANDLSRGTRARRFRIGTGIVLILGFALYAPCRQAIKLASASFTKDPAVLAERRYRRVIETLPPRGVYGYRAIGPLKIGRNYELDGRWSRSPST